MKNYVKRFVLLLAAVLMMGCAATALAKGEPISKTIEQSHTYDYGTLKITVDQWRHEFKKTDLRYFVAHVYTTRPEQLRTAFAGEKYSKDLAEAPKDIAARHDAVLAINGDSYNYKENSGLIIRNGELYRELGTSRHQLLIYKDGTMKGLMPEGYEKGKGLLVKCANGTLAVTKVQFTGGKKMPVEDYLRGHDIENGTVLGKE